MLNGDNPDDQQHRLPSRESGPASDDVITSPGCPGGSGVGIRYVKPDRVAAEGQRLARCLVGGILTA